MKTYPFLNLATVNAPYMPAIKEAVGRVIESGWYCGGPEVENFEKELGAMIGVDHAIGVSNGLDALRLILRGYIELGCLKPGDGIIVNANTYIASVLAISDCGLRPILAEPDEATANLSGDTIARALASDKGARGVMLVHLYGRMAWDDAIAKVVADHDLLVVEDVAQAIGARVMIDGEVKRAGSVGDAGGFSFYPTKNIGAMGDAGAVTTNDSDLAAVVRALRNYGSDRRYHNIYRGLNCRLDPIQAAVLRVKLPFTDAENSHRGQLAAVYDSMITNRKVTLPPYAPDFAMVWHQYAVQVENRDGFRQFLAEHGVQTDVNYPQAVHEQPCYDGLAPVGAFPVAEGYCRRVVSLPISSCTSVDDAREIAAIINRW